MDSIKVLIADDEAEVRAALADLVTSERCLELVGSACDAEEAVAIARARRPDVALVDVKMPGGGGPQAARDILRYSPRTRVIALSAYEDRKTVLQMLAAGAVGYLVKGTAPDEIVRAVLRAVRGQTSMSSEVMASVVYELSDQLRREEVRSEQRREKIERIRSAINGAGFAIAFQPIFDLRDRTVIGYEALARFELPPERAPDAWFAEAAELGLGLELELFSVRSAMASLPLLPPDVFLSVNVSHRTAMSAHLLEEIGSAPMKRMVAEITEHEPVDDYEALVAGLGQFRIRGGRVAIDDAGAGFSSLRHTLVLNPDIIKLDISLTRGIDANRGQRALAAALISFADEMGMDIVAEGIETQADLEALASLGVRFGQGFYLAAPAPLR